MEKKIGTFAVIYFIIGLAFAITFAWFYHWPALSYFSPGFYVVVLTWPIQIPGFIYDFQYFGFAGKPF
jgi:hypothetical protein